MPMVPTGGGVGQAQEVLKELQKQTQQPKTPEKSFDSVLQKGAEQPGAVKPSSVNNLSAQQQVNATQNLTQVNPLNQTDKINQSQKLAKQQVQGAQKSQSGAPSPLKSLFNTWNKDSSSMDKIMKVAMSGQNFSPGELLVLQSATFKVTFELDAMNKLVETTSGAVKQTMQTQV